MSQKYKTRLCKSRSREDDFSSNFYCLIFLFVQEAAETAKKRGKILRPGLPPWKYTGNNKEGEKVDLQVVTCVLSVA